MPVCRSSGASRLGAHQKATPRTGGPSLKKNAHQEKVEDPIMASLAITLWIYIQPDRNKIAPS